MAGGGGAGEKAPIIIKKVNKGGDAHHGGAWKVAYADFVTAMMAFFLLLWLLNVTTSEQKMGIADYFAPASASKQESGSGGILGGRTMSVPGSQMNASSPETIEVPTPGPPATGKGDGDADGEKDEAKQFDKLGGKHAIDANRDGKVDEKELQEALAKHEAQQFEKAATELRQAIQQVPELQSLAQNLVIDQTREGLRIQLVDQEGYSMFPGGSAKMFPQTAQLLALVSQAVGKLPNKLSISGHTDSTPYAPGSSYGNWELSTDRANASRRALEAAGVDSGRIETVVGKADKEHLFPNDPRSPRNRRISIVLLREQNAAAPAAAPAPAQAAPLPGSLPTIPAPPVPGPATSR
ncbi:flagellar motor protein MotB [Aerophototrophica crusticola]|uniref:Flagellar motor protein MotB n=1 Tax=Aerophototrophica crusticola TaxID=1709002 RepID=A0A858R602_9PROT|nr:flagellar motor protein MotB [Rhodospirillaceae bacterium B3]